MTGLKGDPKTIEDARTALEDAWGRVDGVKNQVGAEVEEVGTLWTGAAATLYAQVHTDYQTNVTKLTNALTALADAMGDVALRSHADIDDRQEVIQSMYRMSQSAE